MVILFVDNGSRLIGMYFDMDLMIQDVTMSLLLTSRRKVSVDFSLVTFTDFPESTIGITLIHANEQMSK